MTQHDPAISLLQMLKTAEEAVAMARGRARADLDTDRMLELSLIRLTEVIGEAAGRVPREVQQAHPEIPWALAITMRNRLIHGYDAVDLDALWDTITDDLPPLITQLRALLPH
jgi:uncharacterized protein with HEPN domain